MASGEAWFRVPESIKFEFAGALGAYVTGKDIILYTIGRIGVDGALYQAMEFTGSAIERLSMDSRFSMCNMAIEAGGKSGIIVPDAVTEQYVNGRAKRPFTLYASDTNARYAEVREYDCSTIPPTVSCPHLPSNTRPARELSAVTIDQVVVGSCTNGRLEDLREAALVLKGRKVNPNVRMIVFPATQQI